MTPTIRPSVAQLIDPEFLSLSNLPSIKAAIERADAVLVPYLDAGAVYIEIPSEQLCGPGKSLSDSAVLFSLLPRDFATLPARSVDGAVVYDDAFSYISNAAKRAGKCVATVCRVNLSLFRAAAFHQARHAQALGQAALPSWA